MMPLELDLSTREAVDFIKSQDDVALWHEAAMAVIAYCHDDHGFLPWLLQQPRMDRATAGWLFLWPEGSLYLRGETSHFDLLDNSTKVEMTALFAALCERSETTGFAHEELGLDPGFEAERQKCLSVIAGGQVAQGIIVPHQLLTRPFRPASRSRYDTVDGGIIVEAAFGKP